MIETMTKTTGCAWWKGWDWSANGSRRHGTIPGSFWLTVDFKDVI